MKTKSLFLIFFVFTVLLVCYFASTVFSIASSGAIGNIEKYPFQNVEANTLKEALNKVYTKYPELIYSDTIKYGKNTGEEFYFLLNHEGKKYVFQCNVVAYDIGYNKQTDVSLTTAAEWGEGMGMESDIRFFEKRKYRNLFEKYILPKIKKEIKEQ